MVTRCYQKKSKFSVLGRTVMSYWRSLTLLLAPLILLPVILLYDRLSLTQQAGSCLYMLLLMAVYWCTEALPLTVTALLPLAVAPLLGILEAKSVCKNYFTDKIVLAFGSLIVATAIQHTGLHRRISLNCIKLFGTNPRFLMLGFMLPTWFLSMWISNTATTAMMVSILNCVITQLQENNEITAPTLTNIKIETTRKRDVTIEITDLSGENTTTADNLSSDGVADSKNESMERRKAPPSKEFFSMAKCLSLAVCYSATCGGVATLTGTGTNVLFYQHTITIGERLGYDLGVTFPRWMMFALPVSIILLFICWVWLQILFLGIRRRIRQTAEEKKIISSVIEKQLSALGGMQWNEAITLAHFATLSLLWLTRSPGKAGGWGLLFPSGYVSDATAAMFVSILLMIMPKEPPRILSRLLLCKHRLTSTKKFEPLLPWSVVSEKLPWGPLFLIAGGLALADCADKSGLSLAIGESLTFVRGFPNWSMILLLCSLTAVVTEFTSNAVIAALIIPIIADVAINMEMNPLFLIVPVCVAASFAFMLPAATPPNAIVYASGVLTIKDMVLAGFLLNIIAVLLVTMATFGWANPIFEFEAFTFPNNTQSNVNLNMTLP